MSNHYWISWYQPTSDHRPISYPPNDNVLGWWCTGFRCEDDAATLVAHVTAESVEAAKQSILIDWPEADEWRFCEITDAHPPKSDRFPLCDVWMQERFSSLLEQGE